MNPHTPAPRAAHPAARHRAASHHRIRRALAAALRTGLLVALLAGPGACQRWWPGRSQPAQAVSQRPFPELDQLSAVVAEVRAILPSVPLGIKPTPLGASPAPPAPEPRLVLEGEGRLLRPSAFPDLPPRLRVQVYLDHRTPPGGYLSVTDAQGTGRWRVLDSAQNGPRDGAFAITLRLSDNKGRLRYLVLLGVPFETGGQHYRSLEGYVVLPGADGALSTTGPVYPVDFGYRHPHPPPPVTAARALAQRLRELRGTTAQLQAQAADLAKLQDEARKLAATPVPANQADQQRKDVASLNDRVAAARRQVDQTRASLHRALRALYRERARLTETWIAFTEGNAYRWSDAAAQRAAYAPVRALGADASALKQAYDALHGNHDADLSAARDALHKALEREQAHTPPAAG